MSKLTFALYFANRGFFPESLIAGARAEIVEAVTKAGHDYILMPEDATRFGAVETRDEGMLYAKFLKEHEGQYDGVIMSLPNFGDENGAVPAMRDAGVPILIQAYPDEIGKMDFESRRDAYCGKFSMEDMFNQYDIPYTVFAPHVVSPLSDDFQQNLRDFAAVCRIVKTCKRFTIGGIGARTTAFKTVRFDELALQKAGITYESHDLSELFHRMRLMADDRPEVKETRESLHNYCDFSKVPAEKENWLVKMAVAVEDMSKEYHFDALSLRCWNEMHQQFGIAPCVLLGWFNDRGIATSCEMDVTHVLTMRALSAASQAPAACLDWNNNYGDDPDKVILFHCGSTAESLMEKKGQVGVHKMFAKGNGPDYGWGVDEGRIAKMPMTFACALTEKGKLVTCMGKGEFTGEPIEDAFFGCGGVARIDDLQKKLIYMGRRGFRHHTTVTRGDWVTAMDEAFSNYLKLDNTVL
ncbi:MAG: hypothetical protein E7324_04465 [Clostridiales bacterium]|nr:hypothetical protein [Clostridiales bacterium]